jgi:hypothetical protein
MTVKTIHAEPTRVNRMRAMVPMFIGSVLLIAPLGCGDDDSPAPSVDGDSDGAPSDGSSSDGSINDGDPGDSGTAPDGASGDGDDASASPPTQQTDLGSCEGELLLRDYPVKVTATGLSAADGTPVWGWVSFRLDYDFCSVLGETQVQDGAFTLALTAISDGDYFPRIAFWIDENRDGQCDPDNEVVFRSQEYGGPESFDFELSSEEIADSFYNTERDTACEPFDRFVQP